MKDRKLSTIELTVLGMAWLRGPCTIYAIMKELSSSASTFHRSRAGTAYSVAHRMLEFGLLEAATTEAHPDDHKVRITDAGTAALREWLVPPIPIEDIAHSADLLRLRFFFLGAANAEERLAFIASSLEGLHVFLARCEGLIQANEEIGDYFGALATLSSVLETKARIQWLQTVRKWVETPIPPGQSWTDALLSQEG